MNQNEIQDLWAETQRLERILKDQKKQIMDASKPSLMSWFAFGASCFLIGKFLL